MTKEQVLACETAASLINEIPIAADKAESRKKWLCGCMCIFGAPNANVWLFILDMHNQNKKIYDKTLKGAELTSGNVKKAVQEALDIINNY